MLELGPWLARRRRSAALAVLALLGVLLVWGLVALLGPGPLQAATPFLIPKGLGVEGIAARLAEGGIVAHPRLFALTVRALGRHRALRAGEYLFPARVSPYQTMEILIYAKPVVRRLTVPEGLTTAQVLDVIAHNEALDGPIKEEPPEGSLLPETYNFSYGDSREEVVARLRKAMSETLANLWKTHPPDFVLKTPEEALGLASIVEKETAKPEERPHVAAVFLNRLRHHMRLQSDPTVVYALTHGKGALGWPLGHADLEVPSRYNTYLNDGLPPGPIGNPGKASILAVLHPAESDDLYFVADGTGGHVFAKTLAEHNKNVARWRQLQGAGDGAKAPE